VAWVRCLLGLARPSPEAARDTMAARPPQLLAGTAPAPGGGVQREHWAPRGGEGPGDFAARAGTVSLSCLRDERARESRTTFHAGECESDPGSLTPKQGKAADVG